MLLFTHNIIPSNRGYYNHGCFLFSCLALEEERRSFVDLFVTAATESERALPYADEEPLSSPASCDVSSQWWVVQDACACAH